MQIIIWILLNLRRARQHTFYEHRRCLFSQKDKVPTCRKDTELKRFPSRYWQVPCVRGQKGTRGPFSEAGFIDDGKIIFPFDAVHVDFTLTAAA